MHRDPVAVAGSGEAGQRDGKRKAETLLQNFASSRVFGREQSISWPLIKLEITA